MRRWTRIWLASVAVLSLTLFLASAAPSSRSDDWAQQKQDRQAYESLLNRMNAGEQLTVPEKELLVRLDGQYGPKYSSRNPLDNQGGPDAFGYSFVDNVAPDTATYNWIELRGDPEATWFSGFTSTDDGYCPTPGQIGFNFPFYGQTYTTFTVTSNGQIEFGAAYPFDYWTCLPQPDLGPMIMADMYDAHLQYGGGDNPDNVVAYKNFGNYTVIEYDSLGRCCSPGTSTKFEVILFNTGRIKLQYNQQILNNGTMGSVGIQNADASTYLEYRCQSNGNGSMPITDGLAIWIYQPAGIPVPPTNLAGAVNGTDVTLTWTDPTTDTNGDPIQIENVQVWLGPVGSGNLLATVNAGVQTYTHTNAPNGTLTYNVRAFNDPHFSSPASVTVVVGNPSYFQNFDTDDGEFVASPDNGWQWGAPAWRGPHSAPNVWAAGLGGSYPNLADWYVTLDPAQPITSDQASVEVWINYYCEGYFDGANFQISVDGGSTWTIVTPEGGYPEDQMWNGEPGWSGDNGDWQQAILPLGAWVGETPLFRFHYASDGSVTYQGFMFDDMVIWGLSPPVFASVTGTVTLNGGNGNVTQAVVRANGIGSPQTNPAANGTYTLNNVLVGERRIIASLTGYHNDTLVVNVPEGGYAGANFTLTRLDPPAPTNFVVVTFDTANGILNFNWDDSSDPLVDYYNLYRKLRDDDVWVLAHTYVASAGADTLPGSGIWQHAVTAVDAGATPPVESSRSANIETTWGELPPSHLHVNGNFDDHVRLTWLPPGVQESLQLFYDDSTSEAFYVVAFPNGEHDYFAVRFTPPDTVDYPLPIQTANVYMQSSVPLPNIWLCPDAGGVPDMNNPFMNWQNIGANGDPGWVIAHADGEVMLEDASDFWMIWQFPPGQNGPGTGSDSNAPDGRSYWTWDNTPGVWNQWMAHDWMARIWAGGEAGWGVVMSVGDPSGYSVTAIPTGTTAPSAEETRHLASKRSAGVGPVRLTSPIAKGFAAVSNPVREAIERPYSKAPDLEYQQRPGHNPLDQQLLYYIVYRDATDIAHPTETSYNDFLPENQPHNYYVTGWYDNNEESGPTSTVNGAANMAPGAPSGANGVTLSNTDIRIEWVDPTACANGQPLVDLAGLRIYRDTTYVATVNPGVQQYVDTPPQANRTYTWSIRGIDEVPNEGPGATWSGSVVLPWNECNYSWIDITGNGTNTGLTGDDQTMGPFDIGFPFMYYGNVYDQVWICSNGWISFTSTTEIRYWNAPLPDPVAPNNCIYVFWDDLYLPQGGQIYYHTDVANGQFIVEWNQVPNIDGSGAYTMEIVLDSDGGVNLQYNDLTGAINGCVIGVENATGTSGIMVWNNGQPEGDWILANQSSVCFWGPEPVYADVTGTVTLDGGAGNVTSVLVEANGVSHPQTNPAANGTYTLPGVMVGDRRILATLAGYHTDTLFVTVPEGGYNGANLTLRRLNPPAPTNLTGTVNSGNGVVTLDWDNSPDPLVDGYNIYRKLATEQNWIFDQYVTVSNDFDTLTVDGIWQYAVTAVDNNVTPPAVESSRSNIVVVLYGELPPGSMTANGNFDDRIRLNWLEPGIHQSYQILYDDSSSEIFMRVTSPNQEHDYFATRFTPPSADTTAYPLAIQTANVYMERSDPLPNVWLCPDNGGVPDMNNPLINWQDIGADATPGWLTAHVDGDIMLDDDVDFWMVWQFPPGITGPGTGTDWSAPDGRSYWTYDGTPGIWNQWTSGDWMARMWLGGEPGWGVVLSVGGPSGYSIDRVPLGQTAPTAEMLKLANEDRSQRSTVGPVRTGSAKAAKGNATRSPFPVALEERFDQPYSQAPALVYQQRPGRSTLDDILYYKIYRDAAFLANDTLPPYDNIVGSAGENVTHSYYVTAYYDNNQESPPSNTVQAAANMAPAAPGNINGNPIGSSQMQVTWSDPTLNADGTTCVDLAGARVYRNGTLIATVNPGVQTYTDTPPDPDQFYTWTIRAIDEVPNEGPGADFIGAVQSPWQTCDYEWVDITANGTQIVMCDDCNQGPFPLGFDIEYFGQTYSEIRVCSNGWLSFTSTNADLDYYYDCSTWPNTQEPNALMAAFWDDLYPTSGQCRYYADAANERFIVSWDNCPHYGSGETYTFQVILGANGSVTMNYQTVPISNSTVIGVENADGTQGLLVNCHGDGPYTPSDQTSVCFWGGPSGSLEGVVRSFGNNQPIEGVRVETAEVPEFTFTDASGFYSLPLEPGTYTVSYTRQGYCDTTFANILIEDNNITVRNVTMRAPAAQFSVTSLTMATWPGHIVEDTVIVSNTGGQCPLEFTVTDTSAWLSQDPAAGVVPVNGSVVIRVFANPAGLAPGSDHQSTMMINHGALSSPTPIPVTFSISLSADDPGMIPTEYTLYQNYPNPFNATTSMRFDIPQTSRVKLVLYNVTGQVVATVVDATYPAGRHQVQYDATDLPSGMYLMKLEAGSYTAMRKMLLLK